MENYKEHISVDPKLMLGKPVIKGTRITVELIIEKLSKGETIEDLLEAHPRLAIENIYAALAYAVDVIKDEKIYPAAI